LKVVSSVYSAVTDVPIAEQTSRNRSVIFLDDSTDVSSPAKPARQNTKLNVISFELISKNSQI
jgi:hypothetical protein